MSLEHLRQLVDKQQEARNQWQEGSPADVTRMLHEEVGELAHAIDNYDLLENGVFEVASELGDIMYLVMRLHSMTGLDPEKTLEMKIMRNSLKHGEFFYNSFEQPDAYRYARNMWKMMGGDALFYQAYLVMQGMIEDERDGA